MDTAIYVGPLTTTFTPPASCLGTTGKVGDLGTPFELFTGGVASALDIAPGYQAFDCYPSLYRADYGVNVDVYFSPGVCPSGYTIALTSVTGPETRAVCCLKGLKATNFESCSTTIKAPVTITQYLTFDGKVHPVQTGTKVANNVTLFGSAIEIRFRSGSNPPATVPIQTLMTTTPTPTSTISHTNEGSQFTKTRTTMSLVAPSQAGGGAVLSNTSGDLSTGAKVAIGVAVPVAVVTVLAVMAIFYLRNRAHRLKAAKS